METNKLLGAGLALVLACGSASTQGLPDATAPRVYGTLPAKAWIDAALAADRGLRARRLELARAETALAALENPSLATPSLETGAATVVLPGAGSPASFSAKPALAVTLAEPWGTGAKLAVGIDAPLDGSAKPNFLPALTLDQPLDSLVYGRIPVGTLEARRAAADAESALRAAEAQVAASTLQLLQAWAQAGYEVSSRRAALSQAERALAEAKALRSWAPGSAAQARLENAVASASIALEKANRALERARDAAVAATGLEDLAPPAPPDGDRAPLEALSVDAARSVAQTLRRLAVEERSFRDRWGEPSASLAANLSASAATLSPSGAYTFSGRLGASAAWDDLNLAAGVGWDGRASLPYLDFSLAWKPGSASAESADRLKAELSLESTRLSLETARAQALDALDGLLASRADRELDSRRLAGALALAASELAEARAQAAAGLAALSAVDEALDLWIQAAAAVEKASWERAVADARTAIDFIPPEVSE